MKIYRLRVKVKSNSNAKIVIKLKKGTIVVKKFAEKYFLHNLYCICIKMRELLDQSHYFFKCVYYCQAKGLMIEKKLKIVEKPKNSPFIFPIQMFSN